MKPVWIYGGGGHAKVVIDIAERSHAPIAGVIDDDPQKWGTSLGGHCIVGGFDTLRKLHTPEEQVIIAIGDNTTRQAIAMRLETAGIALLTVVHPSACIGRGVRLEAGCVLMPGTIVNADSFIGRGAIINTAASIDHDCSLGCYTHLSPGARLGGNVSIGDRSWLGINASVIPGRRVGADCIVGAGAVVIQDVPDHTKVVGVPARPLSSGERG